MTIGVYCIANSINGKVYVGSASKSIKSRWCLHVSELRRGRHHSPHLQAAWNKYGEEAFELTTLEECPAEVCVEREQYYLDLFRAADTNYGYNMAPKAGSCLGVRHKPETPEMFARRSAAMKKNFMAGKQSVVFQMRQARAHLTPTKLTAEQEDEIKRRCVLSPSGGAGRKGLRKTEVLPNSLTALAKEFGVNKQTILNIVRGKGARRSGN